MNPFVEQRILEVRKNGYELDFGTFFKNGFQIWKKVTLPIICATLLLAIPTMIIYLPAIPFILGMSYDEIGMLFKNPDLLKSFTPPSGIEFKLRGLIFQLISTCALAPISAGYLKLCMDSDLHDRISFSAIFKYYSPKYYGKILVVSLIMFVVYTIPASFLDSVSFGTGISIILFVITHSFTILAIPFIIFAEASPLDALKNSIVLIGRNYIIVLAFLFVGLVLVFFILGLLLCCIGFLFTFSYIYITRYLLYKQIVGFETPDSDEDIIYAIQRNDQY